MLNRYKRLIGNSFCPILIIRLSIWLKKSKNQIEAILTKKSPLVKCFFCENQKIKDKFHINFNISCVVHLILIRRFFFLEFIFHRTFFRFQITEMKGIWFKNKNNYFHTFLHRQLQRNIINFIVISSIKNFHITNTEIATVTPIKSILNNYYSKWCREPHSVFFYFNKINLGPTILGSLHCCIFVIKWTILYCHSFSIIFFSPNLKLPENSFIRNYLEKLWSNQNANNK